MVSGWVGIGGGAREDGGGSGKDGCLCSMALESCGFDVVCSPDWMGVLLLWRTLVVVGRSCWQ